MNNFELIRELCEVSAPSGKENGAQRLAAEICAEIGLETEFLPCGGVVGRRPCGKSGAPVIMLDAHLDQISMMVKETVEGGFVRFAKAGGIDARSLLASEVTIHCRGGDIAGVVACKPPHLTDKKSREKTPDISELYIDTGFSKQRLDELCSAGDMITLCGPFTRLDGGRIAARSLDNRLGAACLLNTAKALADEKLNADLAFCFTAQEEAGLRGARQAAARIKPAQAIVVDVSHALTPDAKRPQCGIMGDGAMIGYSPGLSRRIYRELTAAAERRGIKYQSEIMPGPTGTNCDVLTCHMGGIATGLLSIPVKYMHSPMEVADIKDLCSATEILAEYLKSCGKEDRR